MANVVAYNPYLYVMGGGEYYFLVALQEIARRHSVTIILPDTISDNGFWKVVQDVFAIDQFPAILSRERLVTDHFDLCIVVNNAEIKRLFACSQINIVQLPGSYNVCDAVELIVYNSMYTSSACMGISSQCVTEVVTPPVPHPTQRSRKKKRSILSVGRFGESVHAKNELDLLWAAKTILKHRSNGDVTFHLVGKTTLASPEYIGKLSQESCDRIHIHLDINRIELTKLYQQSQLFWSGTGFGFDLQLNPERAEHYGIAVAEAALHHAIPLVQPLGGYLDFLEPGKTCQPWISLDDLVFESHRLLNDPVAYTKMVSNLKENQWVKRILSPSKFAEKWLSIAEGILKC